MEIDTDSPVIPVDVTIFRVCQACGGLNLCECGPKASLSLWQEAFLRIMRACGYPDVDEHFRSKGRYVDPREVAMRVEVYAEAFKHGIGEQELTQDRQEIEQIRRDANS